MCVVHGEGDVIIWKKTLIKETKKKQREKKRVCVCIRTVKRRKEGRKEGTINEFAGISQMLSLYIEREESKEGGHKRSERRERQKML